MTDMWSGRAECAAFAFRKLWEGGRRGEREVHQPIIDDEATDTAAAATTTIVPTPQQHRAYYRIRHRVLSSTQRTRV